MNRAVKHAVEKVNPAANHLAEMMNNRGFEYVYGPVASRRLGSSLGIDLVPFKICSYDCVYCQLGRTTSKTVKRKVYFDTKKILTEIQEKLTAGLAPNFVTLAGSGEPTLNSDIGEIISQIKKSTDIPVAVLTNGSLLGLKDVQKDLSAADLVIPSLDAGDEYLFNYINRPHPGISFKNMLQGLVEFSRVFEGKLWLEIFLLGGVNAIRSEVDKLALCSEKIAAEKIQLNTVSRPPAEEFAYAVETERLNYFQDYFPGNVEIISENWTTETTSAGLSQTSDTAILELLKRRPCTVQGISAGLNMKAAQVTKRLGVLCQNGKVIQTRINEQIFFEAEKSEQS
jgi:wyosine [tRNA(Phe)-imidazoG37] synthetase (radical SAM superfamily)